MNKIILDAITMWNRDLVIYEETGVESDFIKRVEKYNEAKIDAKD